MSLTSTGSAGTFLAKAGHRQRAFRDALCDILPPEYGFLPTLRIADFEVREWLHTPNAPERMWALLGERL